MSFDVTVRGLIDDARKLEREHTKIDALRIVNSMARAALAEGRHAQALALGQAFLAIEKNVRVSEIARAS